MTLAGQVVVDGAYALARGGAVSLSDAGGQRRVGLDGAVQAGAELRVGGRTVAGGAGFVVVPTLGGKQAPSLIGNDGSTLIGNDGSTLIGNDGSTLIGNDGSTLIGNDGSTLMTEGKSGTLIGNDGSTYRLAQAGGAAVGAPAVACGMWLSVVDQRTGFTLPLGEDGQGNPVFTIYTDASGGYEVHVPTEAAPFVRVVARAPGRRDPRMTLQVLADARVGQQRVDDDEAAVTGFVREIIAGRVLDMFTLSVDDLLDKLITKGEPGVARPGQALAEQLAVPPLKRMHEAARAVGIPSDRSPATLALAYVLADRVIAEMELHKMVFADDVRVIHDPESQQLVGQLLLPKLLEVAKLMRTAAVQRETNGPFAAFYAKQPWLIDANLLAPPTQRWRIDRPADVMAFVVQAHLSKNHRSDSAKVFDVLADFGLSPRTRDIFALAGDTFAMAFLGAVVGGGDEASGVLEALIRAEGPRLVAALPKSPAPWPVAEPVPVAPAAEPRAVSTLALGANALQGPWGLALDERGDVKRLYVADAAAQVIRRVDLTEPPTTAIVAGAVREAGTADGPGDQARFKRPTDLVLDAEGRLLVVDGGRLVVSQGGRQIVADDSAATIRRLTFDATGAATVETLAGQAGAGGRVPAAIGAQAGNGVPAAEVLLGGVSGVTVDAAGDIWFADGLSHVVRRIRMGAAGRPVETVLGTGIGDRLEGPVASAAFLMPVGVAFEPDGAAVVLSKTNGVVRRVPPPFDATSRTRLIAGGVTSLVRSPDGYWASAWFTEPRAIARDARGRFVVPEQGAHRVRLVHPDGWVSTLAGSGVAGSADGVGAAAAFDRPVSVAIGADGAIYVADNGNRAIRVLR